ncbi:protein ALTERED PHOSPHATE STARVATION RESPONSE 1 isoform X3 [Ricinus communis]|uniref:protein ALTERED PHOSPHATE STARVATION RESPONSE 1 isoform X3 n=1 Tax=Ricinus communis TaxID=3988 RepID=UPI0007722041|nr:protein ALTERED PHOSPHATE STARVATION RESPONSE 1 isoform X3 [Ricinus communis]|eukprot:XP_015579991.1 nitrate regulatory gene2 protein isoform X3 [Ricinus communis]
MGCSTSKLDDEEAVQLCKDRKRFIKQAVEQRTRFATGHLAYIQSLKRVSAALRDYVEGDEPREFLLDSFITPPFTPVKKTSPGFISISPGSFSQPAIQLGANSTLKVNYLRSVGNQAVSVEERPQSPETVRLEAYSPAYQYGYDGYYAMQSSPMYSSFFSYSPNRRPNIPPPSPQTSQWDGFWNPFSSLDYYSYPTRSSLDQMVMDDDIRGLRQVREEEGIPDLEDETEHEETDNKKVNAAEEQAKVDASNVKEEVLVEDVDEDEEDETDSESECGCECENGNSELQSQGSAKIDLSRVQSSGQVEVRSQEMSVGDGEAKAETPAFTVYVNRRPTSMSEVIKDLEDQFIMACNSAKEVSSLLESSKAQYSSMSSELTASSRSSSSRFLVNSSSSRDEGYESNSDFSEESCILSGSHQSTLDRLYAWEKKLYEEVRQSGERIRIAYEKKCMQLRNQDVKGEDPSVVDKTRLAIRDLYTQLQVSIHSAEAVSKRIEALRDEELQPQLLDLVKGLARMWKVMAECHQSQRQTLDAAKLLLAGTPSKLDAKRHSSMSIADPQRLAKSASNLETELRNWRACFEAWITSQRSYMHALTGWLLRCLRSDPDTSKLPFSPRRSSGTFPIFGLCIQWSRFLDVIQEMPVLDGLDFFAAGMGSLYAQQLRDDPTKASSRRYGAGILNESSLNMELVEVGEVEEVMTAEKMAEVAIRVLCAGMSVAASSLTEFSVSSADGYAELVKQWENQPRLLHSSGGTGR